MVLPSRTISIAFPSFAEFSDEELEWEFLRRDGAWHSQTKCIRLAFGSDLLDLNQNWAEQSADYVCPGCKRAKPELAKLTESGVVLCRLDQHHDHLTDYIQQSMRDTLGPQWVHQISENAGRTGHACSELVRRFTPSVICIDCNAADGNAKAKLPEIHRFFSFAPEEIGRFISVAPNREHIVGLDAARAVWLELRETFEDRLALADMLKERLAAGRLAQAIGNVASPTSARSTSLQPLYHIHRQVCRTPGALQSIEADIASLEARSISRHGVASRRRSARKAASMVPTEADVAAHDGGGAPQYWHGVGPQWRCGACERTRQEILRTNPKKKGAWSGRLWKHHEFKIVDMPETGPFIESHQTHLLCGDCFAITAGIKLRQPELSDLQTILQIGDVAAVISAQANGPHEVDWPAAIERGRANRALRAEIESYWRTFRHATSCWRMLEDYRSAYGPERGYARLVERFRLDRPGSDDEEILAHIEWLLEIAGEYRSRPEIMGFDGVSGPE